MCKTLKARVHCGRGKFHGKEEEEEEEKVARRLRLGAGRRERESLLDAPRASARLSPI